MRYGRRMGPTRRSNRSGLGTCLFGLVVLAACNPPPADSRPSPVVSPTPPGSVLTRTDGGEGADGAVVARDAARDDEQATPPSGSANWPPLPDGARSYVFREVLVGRLPYPSRRVTWQLALAGKQVVLRREAEVSVKPFLRIDGTTHEAAGWRGVTRTVWQGERDPGLVHLGKIALSRTFGPVRVVADAPSAELPSQLDLSCKQETLLVRAANATLTPGIKRNDDTMTRPTWSPSAASPLPGAWVCTVVQDVPQDVLLWFTKALAFAPMRKSPNPPAGVEWAFANDDMVLQDGGYRYVPRASLPDWARAEASLDGPSSRSP